MKRTICTIIATVGISFAAYATSTGGPSTGTMGSGSPIPNTMNTIQKPNPTPTPDVNTGTTINTNTGSTGTNTGTGGLNNPTTTPNTGINPNTGTTIDNGTTTPTDSGVSN